MVTRTKPANAVDPAKFWSTVDQYMWPPHRAVADATPTDIGGGISAGLGLGGPVVLEGPLVHRLISALLPATTTTVGATANGAPARPATGFPPAAGASTDGSTGADPGVGALTRGGADPGVGALTRGADLASSLQSLDAPLRVTLGGLGLIRADCGPPDLQQPAVTDELAATQRKLFPIARANARARTTLLQRAHAASADELRRRLRLAAAARMRSRSGRLSAAGRAIASKRKK